MFNTISNISRKSDRYGDVHFISFLSATLSRLAYLNDNDFLKNYSSIMGPVIPLKILQGIDSVNQTNLYELLDDQKIFGLIQNSNDLFKDYEYEYKQKKFIDFIGLNMPQNINIINNEIKGTPVYKIIGIPPTEGSIKYISIGWSNYGEVYVVADKRMPHTLFVLFRGTYSAKTAGLYSKPTSIVPLTVCNDKNGKSESFLYGIFKPTIELLHTIIEAMSYLATNFLGATEPNSIKVFTTGHSLGGAMCTNFAYLWMGIRKTEPYNLAPYNVLSENIVCISLGSPRCMSSNISEKFCNFVEQKKILYLRITTRGDPVAGLPPKTGFQHPCSLNSKMREIVVEDCNSQLTARGYINVNYNGNLDCQNHKTRVYVPNPLSHTVYLDILYTNAVDIVNFIKGIGISKEVLRDSDKSTICRLVMGTFGVDYKAIFFNVNKARKIPTNIDAMEEVELQKVDPNMVNVLEIQQTPSVNGGGFFSSSKVTTSTTATPIKSSKSIAEDVRMDKTSFQKLINEMIPLTDNLSPQKGKMFDPFTNIIMPNLSCPSLKFGGKKRKTKNRKNKTGRKNKTRRNRKKYKY